MERRAVIGRGAILKRFRTQSSSDFVRGQITHGRGGRDAQKDFRKPFEDGVFGGGDFGTQQNTATFNDKNGLG